MIKIRAPIWSDILCHSGASGGQLPAATWLQERLGSLLGSNLGHLGVHFEVPNRSKNGIENKLIFQRFWGHPGNPPAGIREGTLTWLGPGGLIGGGETSLIVSMYQMYQGFKDSWYQSIYITRTLGDNRLRFYAFHRFYQRPPLSLVTPTRGVGGFP